MSKIIYDVIQRFEVENGVPRLVSTNIQVIEGGEDLLSLAISLLTKLGFYDKFEEKRTSQYIGYRLKNPGKGAKRYQLVLSQRKEELCISIPQEILDPYLLKLNFLVYFFSINPESNEIAQATYEKLKTYWILPKKRDAFFELTKEYKQTFKAQYFGKFEFVENTVIIDVTENYQRCQDFLKEYPLLRNLDASDCNLNLEADNEIKDKLFNYASQICINSKEVLEEFITHFAKILMEKN